MVFKHKLSIPQILAMLFTILWVSLIGLDYYNKHPLYFFSFKYFKFPKFILASIIHCLVLVFLSSNLNKWKVSVPKILLVVPIVLQIFMTVVAYKNFAQTPTSLVDCWNLTLKTLSALGMLLLYTFLFANVGSRIHGISVNKKVIPDKFFVNIGLGIVCYTMAMFVFGLFGFLNAYVIVGLLVVMVLANPFSFVQLLKKGLLGRIPFVKFNSISVALIFVIIAYLLINFISIQGPFPNGFDSKNVYINISKLVANAGGLISGFPPYNWSLFIASGFLLGNWVELGLGLSFYGFLLAMITIYYIAREKLNLDASKTLFVILLVTVTPAITNQLYIELKVDYGLLYFQLLSVYLFIDIIKHIQKVNLSTREGKSYLLLSSILLGIFIGFGLGIKMINMFLVMTLIALTWFDKEDSFGFLGALCFTLSALLIAQVDQVSGLGDYHLGVGLLKIIMLIASFVFLGFSYLKHQKRFKLRFLFTFLYLFFAGLFLMPWLAKSYSDTGSINPKELLKGENAGVDLNTRKILKNYRNQKK